MKGTKFDDGKPRWSLLPMKELSEVVDVLTEGAVVHGDDNWKSVPNLEVRYYDAAMRHLTDWKMGKKRDKITNRSNLAHVICNILFLMWYDNDKNT